MSTAYLVYRYLSTLLFWTVLPFLCLYANFNRAYKDSLPQRMGIYPGRFRQLKKKRPVLWMHAASVGEVSVARVIAEEIRLLVPECTIVVSTTTHTGYEYARKKLPPYADQVYAPVDSVFAVKKALSSISPDMMICVETEIWPNWFVEASRRGIKTLLVNGRISPKSLKGYLRFPSLMQTVLDTVESFSMIHADDAGRIVMMGAASEKMMVNGNAKYDSLIRSQAAADLGSIRNTYSLTGTESLIVAGSTRQDEDEAVLDAYGKILLDFPETLLFIAPRHVEKAPSILKLSMSRGYDCQLRSRFKDGSGSKRTSPVVIIDTIGELAAVYGAATLSFCGGSLVPLGGQNLLEAAVWGKPVFYGPFMEDFKEARSMIEKVAGNALLVNGSEELAQKVIYYLSHPSECEEVGNRLRAEVLRHQGAAGRHAQLVADILRVSLGGTHG